MIEELRERARKLAVGAGPAVEALEDELGSAQRALRFLADAGLLAWTVPERDGGAPTGGLCPPDDVSTRALCALRRELARGSGMLDIMLVMQGLGTYPIARAGAPKLRAELLPQVASGERIAALALTEPEAGSDLAGVATRALRTERGWRLAGRKSFISNAPIAHFFCLLARTSGEPGERESLAMFHVPAGSLGLQVLPFQVMAPHPIGELVLNDVSLPAEALVGEEGQGLELALATLQRFRASVAAAATGFARRALEESAAHLSRRVQFGRPLSANQGLRFDLAEMDVRLRAAELLVDEAAAAVDAGAPAVAEVARAKLFATEVASWICDRAVQHLGGRGVRRGEVVERLFREVRALRIYEGTSEVQKLILAKEVLARAAPEAG